MKLHAFVLHNVSFDMFFDFKPSTSRLFHAHTFVIDADDTDQAADLIWILTNVDSPDHLRAEHPDLARYADDVAHYRQRRNRSLSMGDVIVFFHGEKPFGAKAVEGVGFKDYNLEDLTSVDGSLGNNRNDTSQAYDAMQDFMQQQNR